MLPLVGTSWGFDKDAQSSLK